VALDQAVAPLAVTIQERFCSKGHGLGLRYGRLIEKQPALQHDPNRLEDVLKVDADEDGVGVMMPPTV
jgi:hypothetical protein